MTTMTVQLPEEKLDRVQKAAVAQNKSADALIEDAIDAYLPRLSAAASAGALDNVAAEVRLSMAIRLYAEWKVSQSVGAEIAGVSRSRFIEELGRAGVSAVQYSPEEILEEALSA